MEDPQIFSNFYEICMRWVENPMTMSPNEEISSWNRAIVFFTWFHIGLLSYGTAARNSSSGLVIIEGSTCYLIFEKVCFKFETNFQCAMKNT